MFIDLGGTVRALSPQATLARLRPLLAKFGITRVAAHENLGNVTIPVTVAFRPNGRLLSTSQGKGISRELADISAIMESIEMFHAERLPAAAVTASANELRRAGTLFVDPVALKPLLRPSLYDPDEPIGWMAATRFTDGAQILVPRTFLSLDTSEQRTERVSAAMLISSNGLASGNTLDEALVHGLYEVIERHALHDYRYALSPAEREGRGVDMASAKEVPHLRELLARLEAADINMWARALHGPLGIPAFAAICGENSGLRRLSKEFPGFGAHYVPEVALARAITESIQSRITAISGSRDDIYAWHYADLNSPHADLVEEARSQVATAHIQLAEIPRPPSFSSFSEVLTWTLARLQQHGYHDLCYFDHRRPEFGDIPVVTVVAPDMVMGISDFHQMERR
jgi:ribosomal protein S12 methylthiotransferase accessory factor